MVSKKFIDIGANLTDPQFHGIYHGRRKHEEDLDEVLKRAQSHGVCHILVTGASLSESHTARELVKKYPGILSSTAGIHPCSSSEVPDGNETESQYWSDLHNLIEKGKRDKTIRAFGEFGLDYDRLHYAPKDKQRAVFARQLELAARSDLPLFLHSRACADDFYEMLAPYLREGRITRGGVVHSFTGTLPEAEKLLTLGLYIGINGCSLKTKENLEVVAQIPLEKIMLETDGPWCQIRPTHASHGLAPALDIESKKPEKFVKGECVKGRCEPCEISRIATVVAAVHDKPESVVIESAWRNTVSVFFPELEVEQVE